VAKIPTSEPECVSDFMGAATGFVWLKSVKLVMLMSTLKLEFAPKFKFPVKNVKF
jgi:hypothetical protein